MRKYFGIILIICSCLLIACSKQTSKGQESQSFSPVIDNNGADPWVFKKDKTYYYTKTTGNNVTLWRSNQLSTVSNGQEKIIWKHPDNFESAWAPELHYLNQEWVIYVAINKPTETHRMYALVNANKDPFKGKWNLKPIEGMDDKFAIDGTVLQLKSENYFIWSGWEGYENIAQNLYIAKMDGSSKIVGKRRMISKPEYEWEKRQMPLINEGPEIIAKGDRINLVYSASGSWDDDYCLGLMTLTNDQDPLIRDNWQKEEEPIMAKTDSIFGPGHCSFTKDEQGKDWMIYHTARWSHAGWARNVRMQEVRFKDDKLINLKPQDNNQLQSLPSGDSPRTVYQAEDGNYTNSLSLVSDSTISKTKLLKGFSERDEQLSRLVNVEKAGNYQIIYYLKMVDIVDPDYQLDATANVNGEEYTSKLSPSDHLQPLYISVPFKKGDNKLVFNLDGGGVKVLLDRLEITK